MKYQSIIISSLKNLSREQLSKLILDELSIKLSIADQNIFTIEAIKNSIGIGELEDIYLWVNLKNDDIKTLIIRDAEKLTTEAQNSMLKLIEEPPEDTVIVLLAKNIESILLTVRSRCIVLNIQEDEGSGNEKEDLAMLARNFLNSDYLERIKVVAILQKDYDNREDIAQFILFLLKEISENKTNLDKIDFLKSAYLGVKKSVNLKLTLDSICIMFEN